MTQLTSAKDGSSMQMPSSLADGLSDFLKEVKPSHVIETGTYEGLGSTRIIAKLLSELNNVKELVTIEANWKSWKKAKRNLQPFSFVKPLWGNTVDVKQASAFITDDEVLKHPEKYSDILFDTPNNQQQFYLDEINGKLGGQVSKRNILTYWKDRSLHFSGNNLLTKYLDKFKSLKPLVVLDSAGGIGWMEFQIVRETMGNRAYHILLDDINHVKHFRSYQAIQEDHRFNIKSIDPNGRWVIASYVPYAQYVLVNNAFLNCFSCKICKQSKWIASKFASKKTIMKLKITMLLIAVLAISLHS